MDTVSLKTPPYLYKTKEISDRTKRSVNANISLSLKMVSCRQQLRSYIATNRPFLKKILTKAIKKKHPNAHMIIIHKIDILETCCKEKRQADVTNAKITTDEVF